MSKWVAWASGIAALRIVQQHTGVVWLSWFWTFLLFILVWRIQWFIARKVRFPEEKKVDGSVVVTFTGWRLLFAITISLGSWWFVIALSNSITQAGLMGTKPEQAIYVAPRPAVDPILEPRQKAKSAPISVPPMVPPKSLEPEKRKADDPLPEAVAKPS